jgi:hypothetical protein
VRDRLPSKCEVLNSNSDTNTKKKKKRKKNIVQMGVGGSSVVEHLSSMHETLSSVPRVF